MVRKFQSFLSEWKKRSTFEGTPQFPNRISGKLPYHLTSNQNFRIFWPNGKHPRAEHAIDQCCHRLPRGGGPRAHVGTLRIVHFSPPVGDFFGKAKHLTGFEDALENFILVL